MSSNYSKLYEKEYDKLVIENEALLKENKRLKDIEKALVSLTAKIDELINTNKTLTKTINNLNDQIKIKDELLKKLTEEIERLKNNNKKD